MSSPTRRKVLIGALAGSAVGLAGVQGYQVLRQPQARVTTLRAASYESDLVDLLLRGLADHPEILARARGARVVLKPNLVEWHAERPINTDARFIVAVVEVFRKLDAAEVIVAEGPGHRRDTEFLLEQTGLAEWFGHLRVPYVDLNIDVPRRVTLPSNYTGFGALRLATTVATADLLVSLPKLKTHHWAGVTLSMKNLFGTVPSSVYGWPKNPLHHAGISRSIVDLWDTLRPAFAIVDGILGMEGDGPLMGEPVPMGVVVMGSNLPAVDATCARIMEIDPRRIDYLRVATAHGGTISSSRVEVVGDVITPHRFRLLPELEARFRG